MPTTTLRQVATEVFAVAVGAEPGQLRRDPLMRPGLTAGIGWQPQPDLLR